MERKRINIVIRTVVFSIENIQHFAIIEKWLQIEWMSGYVHIPWVGQISRAKEHLSIFLK